MDANRPVSDWKNRRLKVGHHLKNARGQVGMVTWVSKAGNALMYRLGVRTLGTKDNFTPAEEKQ